MLPRLVLIRRDTTHIGMKAWGALCEALLSDVEVILVARRLSYLGIIQIASAINPSNICLFRGASQGAL